MGRLDYICNQFRETARCRDAAQHGGGVCCAFAPWLVSILTTNLQGEELLSHQHLHLRPSLFVLWVRGLVATDEITLRHLSM